MKQFQCPRFHLYNAPDGRTGGCPVCAAQDAELARTRGIWGLSGADPDKTLDPPVSLPGRTVGVYDHLGAAVEPVVGWLACIGGPDKGRDWRLVQGRNTIGRGEGMSVRLAADAAISRDRHAVLSFDPRNSRFSLAPGDGAALVYHNGQEVLVPVALAPHDRIELGATTLLFVALAGDRFRWDPPRAATPEDTRDDDSTLPPLPSAPGGERAR